MRAIVALAALLAVTLAIGSRVLDGAFLTSFVAIAVPKGKAAGLAYASAFIDAAIRSGSVRQALDRIDMKTSTVPPPGTQP